MSPQSTSGAILYLDQKSTHHILLLQHTADLLTLGCSQGWPYYPKLASLPHYHALTSHGAFPFLFNPLHHGRPIPHTLSPYHHPPSPRATTKYTSFPSMPWSLRLIVLGFHHSQHLGSSQSPQHYPSPSFPYPFPHPPPSLFSTPTCTHPVQNWSSNPSSPCPPTSYSL